jgi:ABC-type lipoprotein release transport system permease subunit
MRDPSPKLRIKYQDLEKNVVMESSKEIQALPRITSPGMVQTAQGSVGVQLFAIDFKRETPDTHLSLFGLKSGIVTEKKALIGDTMARRLGAELGDPLILSFADGKGDVTNSVTELGGIFHTGSPEMDGHVIVTALSDTQETMGYTPDEASMLAIYTPSQLSIKDYANKLTSKLPRSTYQVSTWQDTLPELYQAITVDSSLQHLLCGFAGVIIGIGILNAMLLSVLERRREFGVVLAIGMTPRELVGMVGFEALLLGFIGLLLGFAVAAPMYYYLATYGLDLTPYLPSDDTQGIEFVDQVLGCRLTISQIVTVSGFLVVTTIAASIFPALKAAKTEPIAAISGRR